MTTRPILFSASMVRAILNGTKTQTRRIAKFCAGQDEFTTELKTGDLVDTADVCPYGKPRDQLWVKETSRLMIGSEESVIQYRADMAIQDLPDGWYSNDPVLYRWIASQSENPKQWRPSILMPQRASRITLEITGIRVERLKAISGPDCWSEGIQHDPEKFGSVTETYRALWESINGLGSWDANPFVWVIEFNRVKP